MVAASLQSVAVNNSVFIQSNLSTYNETQTTTQNASSFPENCQRVVFSEKEFLPWDNPDNIVSEEVEAIAYRISGMAVVFLFLIGGPGNVINMAVFYKQGLKDRVNLCLFALSLADELYFVAAMLHHAEQAYLQFVSTDRYGPVFTFLANHNFTGLFGFMYVSLVLSAIIASERCFCVLSPLKYQTLMSTRTMTVIVILLFIIVAGLYFLVSLRIHVGCVYDPTTGSIMQVADVGEFYKAHKVLVDSLNSFFFGVGLPGVVMIVVATTTIITTVRLRQILTWRSESTSSISAREIGLTKMLIGTSVLFIICVCPFALSRFSWIFLPEMNSGRRHQNFYLTTFWLNKLMSYFNASANICVYYAMGSRYRETFWKIFSRKSVLDRKKEMFSQGSVAYSKQ